MPALKPLMESFTVNLTQRFPSRSNSVMSIAFNEEVSAPASIRTGVTLIYKFIGSKVDEQRLINELADMLYNFLLHGREEEVECHFEILYVRSDRSDAKNILLYNNKTLFISADF